MFRKVHIRLCLLCAGITIFILLAMSFGYLYISEQGLRSNHFISFQNDMNTVLSNLEQQTEITYEWLTRIEAGGKIPDPYSGQRRPSSFQPFGLRNRTSAF